MKTLKIKFTARQSAALRRLLDKITRYLLYGGAKGGGKSYFLCLWVLIHCEMLCKKLGLKPSANPLPLGFLGRKQSIDFKKTTLETWKRFIPAELYEIKKQDGEIILFNGACKVFFGGLDSKDTVNKFNSAELAFFAIDQAEETNREDISVLRGSLRLTYNGIKPDYKELYTANPSDCWLKEDFVDKEQEGYAYVPALPSDNPYLPDDYIKTLEEAFKYSIPLLKAYRDGDWSALKSTNSLLSSDDLNKLKGLSFHRPKSKRIIACDPATSHDECVIYYMRDYRILEQKIIVGETDEMKIAGELVTMARKYDVYDIGGDVIGLGGGIFSRVEELGPYTVHRLNSSESKTIPKIFKNKRAQMYWELMKAVLDKRIYYPEDEELRRQLINITYEVKDSSGTIQITSKDKIKSVLGRSPDRADCFAYAVWISDMAEPYVTKKDAYFSSHTTEYSFNPATV